MKFLFDECLSPELTKLAHAKGYGESTHVVWLGRAGLKDWELKPFILKDDWTFRHEELRGLQRRCRKTGCESQYADVASGYCITSVACKAAHFRPGAGVKIESDAHLLAIDTQVAFTVASSRSRTWLSRGLM